MYLPKAFVQKSQFEAAVARVAQRLGPNIIEVIPTLDHDWTGDPAVFFMVILADSATSRDRLREVTNQAERVILDEIEPMEEWGIRAYFNYRSQSEHAQLKQPASV